MNTQKILEDVNRIVNFSRFQKQELNEDAGSVKDLVNLITRALEISQEDLAKQAREMADKMDDDHKDAFHKLMDACKMKAYTAGDDDDKEESDNEESTEE